MLSKINKSAFVFILVVFSGCIPSYIFNTHISKKKLHLIKRCSAIIERNDSKLLRYKLTSDKFKIIGNNTEYLENQYNSIDDTFLVNKYFASLTLSERDTLNYVIANNIVKTIQFNNVNNISFLLKSSKITYLTFKWDKLYVDYCNGCDTTVLLRVNGDEPLKRYKKLDNNFYKILKKEFIYIGP